MFVVWSEFVNENLFIYFNALDIPLLFAYRRPNNMQYLALKKLPQKFSSLTHSITIKPWIDLNLPLSKTQFHDKLLAWLVSGPNYWVVFCFKPDSNMLFLYCKDYSLRTSWDSNSQSHQFVFFFFGFFGIHGLSCLVLCHCHVKKIASSAGRWNRRSLV